MIPFFIYTLVFTLLIFYNGFFGIFKDDKISKKQFSILFLLKLIAVPVFYVLYKKLYGGIENLDAGIFYQDIKATNNFARENFTEYLKLLFGLQDDSENSYIFRECLVNTKNWDNGYVKDFFYNDNRIVIRIHSLLHFIAFNSYFVHALFCSFLSFVGIVFLYKSIKEFFEGKEFFVLLILCFFPALWFYTGALLKESYTVFVLGCAAFELKSTLVILRHEESQTDASYRQHDKKKFVAKKLWLVCLLFLSFLLKPYVLCISTISFALFFFIQQAGKIKYKSLVFFSIILFGIIFANFSVEKLKHKFLLEAALDHQRNFASVATGGIFLASDTTYIRLEYDTTLVNKISNNPATYTIKKNAPYAYWEDSHHNDTLYCAANQDTITPYHLVFKTPQGGSNINLSNYQNNFFAPWYYSLVYPFFFNAKGIMQFLASFENLAILVSLLFCLISIIRNLVTSSSDSRSVSRSDVSEVSSRYGLQEASKPTRTDKMFPALVFLFIALAVCFIIGITTPNSGAIFRYRSPVVVFILLAGLYYIPFSKNELDE